MRIEKTARPEAAPVAPDASEPTITAKTFFPEEWNLLRKCLEATSSGAYVSADDVKYVTGYDAPTFADLLQRLDKLERLRRADLQIITEAVGVFCNFYTPGVHQIAEIVGVAQLPLKWFWHRLLYIGDHWAQFVTDSGRREQGAKYNRNGEWRF